MVGCLFDDMLVYHGMKGCSRKEEEGCEACRASANHLFSEQASKKRGPSTEIGKDGQGKKKQHRYKEL